MCEMFDCMPDTIVVENNEIYLVGCDVVEKLPPLPKRRKVDNPVVLNGVPYIRGYELVNGKWKRTFKAWVYKHIGWWIW